MKATYRPNHPFNPFPPTILNRLRCRILSHAYHADTIDYATLTVSMVCMRCSRTLTARFPNATLIDNYNPVSPRAQQH